VPLGAPQANDDIWMTGVTGIRGHAGRPILGEGICQRMSKCPRSGLGRGWTG
jgi:hypothetical protein